MRLAAARPMIDLAAPLRMRARLWIDSRAPRGAGRTRLKVHRPEHRPQPRCAVVERRLGQTSEADPVNVADLQDADHGQQAEPRLRRRRDVCGEQLRDAGKTLRDSVEGCERVAVCLVELSYPRALSGQEVERR
jgi:hypothetical protein